jgi:hypothetical protein
LWAEARAVGNVEHRGALSTGRRRCAALSTNPWAKENFIHTSESFTLLRFIAK